MTENFYQINVRGQTTDPGRSENTTQDKYKETQNPNQSKQKTTKKLHLGISHSNWRK